jgi:hypothetical protein
VRYFVDSTTDPAHPTLMQQRLPGTASQPVADDIEDLQFAYGLAATVDNSVVSTTADSASVSQLPLLRRVQVSLIARSRFPETGWPGQRPNIGNRTDTPPADRYRRRVFQDMAVEIRNTRLN